MPEAMWNLKVKNFEELYNIAKGNYSGKTTPSKLYYNAENHNFSFSFERNDGLNSGEGNASVEEYLVSKKEYFLEYVE